MINYFLFTCFSFFIFFLISRLSFRLKLFDIPSTRKIHKYKTPYTGGIALFLLILVIVKFTDVDFHLNQIFIYSFIILIIGFLDDKYNINVGTKTLGQILSIFFLAELISLNSLSKVFYLNNFELGSFGIIFTILCLIVLINSFNYLDGSDGICAISFLIPFNLIFFVQYERILIPADLIIYINIALSIFILFNFSVLKLPKMFLGDSGSLVLGYILGFISIYYYSISKTIEVIEVMWILSFPIFEFLSTNVSRIKRGSRVFKPGFDHLHHIFLKKYNSFITFFIIVFVQIFIILLGLISYNVFGSDISSFIYVILFLIFFLIREKFIS